jgi:hypothetical protein
MKSRSTRYGAITAMLGAVGWLAAPTAAYAELVTFDFVPISENPTSAQTATPMGSITLSITPWTLTAISGNGLGPNYYTSGSTAVTATVEAISYKAGDGQTLTWTAGGPTTGDNSLSVTSMTEIWATSAVDTPAPGSPPCTGCSTPTAGYYLTTQFPSGALSVTGTTAQGAMIMFANNAGTAGANDRNGIGNGDVTVNAAGSIKAIEDGGYWELAPVPLPAGLPLLLSGLGLLGWFARRGLTLTLA